MRFHPARSSSLLFILLGTLAAGLAGCGEGLPSFSDVTPVTGTVKLNGSPLADADVQFVPDFVPPESFLGSTAKTDANGKYELMTGKSKGTIPGKFKVTVSKFADKNGNPIKIDTSTGMDLEQLKASGEAVEMIPTKYSHPIETELRAEVVKGQALVKDLDLNK